MYVFFFFNQKTAYEMRISDWSSDVCSSDLNIFESTYKRVDSADELSSRPDFAIALYPGHLCRAGDAFDPGIQVTKQTPPTFLLQAWDDPVDKICNSTVYARALDAAGVPTEVHLFAKGGHAFGLRPNPHPVDRKSTRLNSSH